MSKLVNYGLGEVCDRLSILSLKIAHGSERQKEVSHFEAEQSVLRKELHVRNGAGGGWMGLLIDLSVVNARLWQQEDLMRSYRTTQAPYAPVDVVATCAFLIQALNDTRAGLIRQINETVGDSAQEKI